MRKGELVRFLSEAGLIISETPIIDLTEADLTEADLTGANLTGAKYNKREFLGLPATRWPKDFDPDKAGAMAKEDAMD